MKPDNNEKNMNKLRELIEAWQINKSMLAKKMGMAWSTFNLKMLERHQAYNFTPEEYRILLRYLLLMANDIKRLYIKGIGQTSDKLTNSKK